MPASPEFFELRGRVAHSPKMRKLPEGSLEVKAQYPDWIGDESSGHPTNRLIPKPLPETLEAARKRTPELAPSLFAQPRKQPE